MASTAINEANVPHLSYPSPRHNDTSRRHTLIFLIPGNPGLATYYTSFLSSLRHLLDEQESRSENNHTARAFHLYARNLLGFSDADHSPSFGTSGTHPFTLEDQIAHLCSAVHSIATTSLGSNRRFDEVILIGHSVGAYMTLEIFHRHHELLKQLSPSTNSTPPTDSLASINLRAGILLFPTVTHIAKSRSGQKLNSIRTTPWLNASAHRLAKGFVDLFPQWALDTIIRRFMGFPTHAAEATVAFLTSRDGIWQALHMGKDEMATITEEKWGDDLWEIRQAENQEEIGSKFYFYFAQTDHWVADECRDEFIERRRRGHERGRTKVVIDEGNIPHAFCIHHSETVAEKVAVWVGEVTGQ